MPVTGLHGNVETSNVFDESEAHIAHIVEYLGYYSVDDDNVWGVTYRNYENEVLRDKSRRRNKKVKNFREWLMDVLEDKGKYRIVQNFH